MRSLPRTFPSSLSSDFVAGLSDELLLCPVRALSDYVARTSLVVNRPRRPFVSFRCSSRVISKYGIYFLLREVILNSDASSGMLRPLGHTVIHGIATSTAFFRNGSLSNVLEAPS